MTDEINQTSLSTPCICTYILIVSLRFTEQESATRVQTDRSREFLRESPESQRNCQYHTLYFLTARELQTNRSSNRLYRCSRILSKIKFWPCTKHLYRLVHDTEMSRVALIERWSNDHVEPSLETDETVFSFFFFLAICCLCRNDRYVARSINRLECAIVIVVF